MKKKKLIFFYILIISCLINVALFSGCISSEGEYIMHDGRKRTYKVHHPTGYNSLEKYPLIIVLHGGMGNSEHIEGVTGMSEKADEEGFIVVYPNGTSLSGLHTWNAGFCCGYAYETDVDDVGFIRALIEKLDKTLQIDTERIFVTGFSNGGMLTYRIGSELSDIIAAIAPVAAAIGGRATEESPLWTIPNPEYPVPVITFMGMEDTAVPYEGGESQVGAYSYLSVNESISFWIEHNNCSTIPQTTVSENGNIIIDMYNSDDNYDVILYTIVDGRHAWPGGERGSSDADEPTQEISATDIIWDFFEGHPKQ
jgi:polyhydroxybutyrate depolymerase